MEAKSMIDLHIIDYNCILNNTESKTTWSLAGNKLIKAGCRMARVMSKKEQRENMQEIYRLMRSYCENTMVGLQVGE